MKKTKSRIGRTPVPATKKMCLPDELAFNCSPLPYEMKSINKKQPTFKDEYMRS